MSMRVWISVITVVLLALVLLASRHELVMAANLLGRVNLTLLLLIIPLQFVSYFAVGAIMFAYLRAKGKLADVSHLQMARVALELNFVNHIIPSGGVAGFSYMGWRMRHFGVSPARATMAQVVRYATAFVAFLLLLALSVLVIAIDGTVSRFAIVSTAILSTSIIFGVLFGVYVLSSLQRLMGFSAWLVRTINGVVARLTRGRRSEMLSRRVADHFFAELHDDFTELRADKGLLKVPFVWAMVLAIAEIALFVVVFASLGITINPAVLLVAYGIATAASLVVLTPGGVGVYEAIMIAFLVASGVEQGVAIAGILLARVLVLVGSIASGYAFYQLTIMRRGKTATKR